uniref:mRNA cap guanine-N(7) methyltransferase n=1 Tax=Eptatretus burgeri TaxID=7764 RepID=A0A8C4QPQ1_EPTBU
MADSGELAAVSALAQEQEVIGVKMKRDGGETTISEQREKKRKCSEDDADGYRAHKTARGDEHGTVVAQHYNMQKEIGLEARSQSRIFYLRNFNNWIKSVLINEFLDQVRRGRVGQNQPLRVLDLGCGKGGDLLKWRKGGIAHLVCADMARTAVDQCQQRYMDMKNRGGRLFTAEFICADCSKSDLRGKFQKPDEAFDLCSCQFAFHYAMESRAQVEMMLHNACAHLRRGGFFFGTTSDARELMRRHQMANVCAREENDGRAAKHENEGTTPNKGFGNEVYHVRFHDTGTSPPPIFGAKYDFHLEGVVDCPEFLVHFPLLECMAQKLGMKLVMKKTFSELFHEFVKKDNGRHLLSVMQALETYPASNGSQLVSADEMEYKHVADFLQNSSNPNDSVGTMSKSEWEAAGMYLAFAFTKQ